MRRSRLQIKMDVLKAVVPKSAVLNRLATLANTNIQKLKQYLSDLEERGFVEIEQIYGKRKPRASMVHITVEGQKALIKYKSTIKELME